MKIDSDSHNFGQSVVKTATASGNYFQKPRPIYWEDLLFGKKSPLARFFESENSDFQPRDFIFNLEVEMNVDFCGRSREIETSSEIILPSHFYSFGVLLAYCYVLGIRDLHKNNVVRTKTHLQVIDAEVVFVDLFLPNETLLLPFKEITYQSSAFNLLGKASPEELSASDKKFILSGYFDTFECFVKNATEVKCVFQTLEQEIATIPVRHIARDTIKYRDWQNQSAVPPYFEDEFIQLKRGDVPYFFKFVNDPKLYQYTSANGDYAAVHIPADFVLAVERDAMNPQWLLSETRFKDRLLPTGALFIGKKLFSLSELNPIDGRHFQLEFTESEIKLKVSGNTYKARR